MVGVGNTFFWEPRIYIMLLIAFQLCIVPHPCCFVVSSVERLWTTNIWKGGRNGRITFWEDIFTHSSSVTANWPYIFISFLTSNKTGIISWLTSFIGKFKITGFTVLKLKLAVRIGNKRSKRHIEPAHLSSTCHLNELNKDLFYTINNIVTACIANNTQWC